MHFFQHIKNIRNRLIQNLNNNLNSLLNLSMWISSDFNTKQDEDL